MKFSVLFTALFAALVTAQHAKGGGGVSAHGKRQHLETCHTPDARDCCSACWGASHYTHIDIPDCCGKCGC
ncbi:uncharacterized protein AKAW2_11151A [Aspergillus luchuensis]|uniref:Uncharacterized protein n=1 Tax=Aspergillus kawachii TaxID=1069201 RepID=A0A7R7W0J0_ASPKA|nr:uncharacterized protein AKAW2_11151A [Aspergillus luchuensis]BCR94105.1 hypothetical protein AKAW2_11151A [Aspergillus luchuensis]BCS06715.1 hypothetical protein ALUC_11096A [Aspergillus luchuensis]GAA84274.1 hypothetical protein AKAW_02389 [Aspergillus luchuensis IFO 4308]